MTTTTGQKSSTPGNVAVYRADVAKYQPNSLPVDNKQPGRNLDATQLRTPTLEARTK